MKIKEGASISGLHLVMRPILIEADKIWEEAGQELVITSGLDGAHSAGSLHYYGLALDFRTRYFSLTEKEEVLGKLKEFMPLIYDVADHSTHIHVEYDPKRSADKDGNK